MALAALLRPLGGLAPNDVQLETHVEMEMQALEDTVTSRALGRGRHPVASERLAGGAAEVAARCLDVAATTPPVELTAQMPEDLLPGQRLCIWGPHGGLDIEIPHGAVPGGPLHYRLGPPPEFSVQVPLGAEEGSPFRLRKADGQDVVVVVPLGKRPGDYFEVAPPALMVRVPLGARPGDQVAFYQLVHRGVCEADGPREAVKVKSDAESEDEWRLVRIPHGLSPGEYFAALID
eukprot:TRINITY_DN45805_c0_g1_i1.p1 TRINITY_DN45805_c0_g1~~TRINITY_DN45805_c0_g1_i1.p1  ORF type:complete len:250 (-),score=37.46 TRINITY_DN45805_c0_g1_i1:27-728(-)